ncbi:MAG: HNH endonuclease [Hyphomonadaceae bacterium]|nr:HNH endonuclease [Hyphomonadaceae bacterium]
MNLTLVKRELWPTKGVDGVFLPWLTPPERFRLVQRLMFGIKLREECWEWTGARLKRGYGSINIRRRQGGRAGEVVHRLMYQLFVGGIPPGREIDHLCRNRICCNPVHLEAITREENIRRGAGPALLKALNGNKTHCVRGHPFNQQNTYRRPAGGRACRTCERNRRNGEARVVED